MKTIYADRRKDETTLGMHGIEGYYRVNGEVIRQEIFYDVKTEGEAIDRARADGLIRPLLLEVIVDEFNPIKNGTGTGFSPVVA